METHEALNDVLNDLVKINNDRIAAYESAIADAKDLDIDLKALFHEMINQSSIYKDELMKVITSNEGLIEDDTSASGKIYRAWLHIKSTFTDTDRLTILDNCEFTEDAAQRSYDAALNADAVKASDAAALLQRQKAGLTKSHDIIKKQYEAHKLLQKR